MLYVKKQKKKRKSTVALFKEVPRFSSSIICHSPCVKNRSKRGKSVKVCSKIAGVTLSDLQHLEQMLRTILNP